MNYAKLITHMNWIEAETRFVFFRDPKPCICGLQEVEFHCYGPLHVISHEVI